MNRLLVIFKNRHQKRHVDHFEKDSCAQEEKLRPPTIPIHQSSSIHQAIDTDLLSVPY